MFPADVFAAFTHTFHVGHNFVRFIVNIASIGLVDVVAVGFVVFPLFYVCPVQSPCWILTTSECFVEMIFFLLKQLVVGKDCLCSVFKSVDSTKLGRQVVVTVPLQVQICMCGLSIH